jgi:hypothetical protein
MPGHASAAMTLDIYECLFGHYLESIDRLRNAS